MNGLTVKWGGFLIMLFGLCWMWLTNGDGDFLFLIVPGLIMWFVGCGIYENSPESKEDSQNNNQQTKVTTCPAWLSKGSQCAWYHVNLCGKLPCVSIRKQ